MNSNLINGQKPEFGNINQIKTLQRKERQLSDEAEYKKAYPKMSNLEKYIDHQSQLGWSIFAIDELQKRAKLRLKANSPIDLYIIRTTGYDKAVVKGFIINLRGHYKMMIRSLRWLGDDDKVCELKVKIKEIDNALKGILKDVKEVEL